MFGFIKRMLGGDSAPSSTKNTPAPTPVAARPVQPVTPAAPKAPPAIVRREEIIDEKTRICGYRFSVHRPDAADPVTPQVTLAALVQNHVAVFAERRLALVKIAPDDWSTVNIQPIVGPNTVFILPLPEAGGDMASWLAASTIIKQAGGKIAASGSEIINLRSQILEHIDFILIDFPAYSLNHLEQTIRKLRALFPKASLIAENLSRWPEQRYCIAHRIAYCLGPFTTAQDEEQQTGEISQSRLILIEMLNGLRQEADLADIAEVAKRDPGVVVKLVAMANSPMLGLAQSITSIDQAIIVLGREQLYRWLSLAMFRMDAGSPRDDVLLELALTRARFLEIIGELQYGKTECDELFLLGLLSLLDILLGVPMQTVVQRINLSSDLSEVLLNSSGPFARYLMLVIAKEKGHGENITRLASQLNIPLDVIESASEAAQDWAGDAMSNN